MFDRVLSNIFLSNNGFSKQKPPLKHNSVLKKYEKAAL
jgi:hypothetical protein